MKTSQAVLKGCVLYIDGRVWADDVTLSEACEIIASMGSYPGAPTGVRTAKPERTLRQVQRSQVRR